MKRNNAININPNQSTLLNAVVLNDIGATKDLLAKLDDKSFLQDIGMLSKPFPLHYISLCNEVIWRDVDAWRDKEMAMRNKEKSCAIVKFWKEYYGVSDFEKIDYLNYRDDLIYDYAGDNEETDDDILMIATKDEYLKCGSREIDVDLLCAVERLNFDKIQSLLDGGANPNADLHYTPIEARTAYDEPDNVLSMISNRCGYLSTEYCSILRAVENNKLFQGRDVLEYLLDVAALTEMCRLLDKYLK